MFGLLMSEYCISQSEFLFIVNDRLRLGVCAEVGVACCLMFVFEMCDAITSVLLSVS